MKVHYSSKSYEWGTPQELFDKLNERYRFVLDVCATRCNAKCDRYFTEDDDGLIQDWSVNGSVFMNPPYGRTIGKWIEKAYMTSKHKTTRVVCLIPARTDTRWWHDYVMKGEITFIKGRLRFVQEGKSDVAPFPSAIVVFKGR